MPSNNAMGPLLKQIMSDNNLQQISGMLGADQKQTQKAIGAALPTLLAALGQNASKPEGAQALANALDKDHDGSILDDIGGYLGNGADVQQGNKILGHLLGSNQAQVQDALGQVAGVDSNSMGMVLAGLAPLVLGALGKQKREDGLDAAGLAEMLLGGGGQQPAGASASSGMMGMLEGLFDRDKDGSAVDDMLSMGSSLLGGLFGGDRR